MDNYGHINKVITLGYVGYTSQQPEKRWKGGRGYKNHPKFYNAIKKYGWNNFEHIILAETDSEESAIIIETMFKIWYDTVENGYNCVLDESKSPTFGKSPTIETRQKMSKAQTGKVMSEEAKQNMSKAQQGKTLSEKHKGKISNTLKGENNPNYGKHWSDEWKQDHSDFMTGRFVGENNPFFGKHHTEESKQKSRDKQRKLDANQIRYIRTELLNGRKVIEIAKEMNVSHATISNIKNGHIYSDIK